MNKKAINTVEKYNMLSKGDRVLVAVSGGADSMALLEFFISIKDKYDLNLCAAHIEHGIRGEESLSDALFVKEYCEKSGVKLYMKSINAPYLAKKQVWVSKNIHDRQDMTFLVQYPVIKLQLPII